MPASLWHLGTCDNFHIICQNGHNYPGLPMVIEVSQAQQWEVRITGSLVRGWFLDTTLVAVSVFPFFFLHSIEWDLTDCASSVCLWYCTNNVWLNVEMLFYNICRNYQNEIRSLHIFTCWHIMSLNVRRKVFNVLKTECEVFTLSQQYVLLNEMAIT